MASYEDVIDKWERYGPNSGVTREQYDKAVEERSSAFADSNTALEEAEAARKQYEEDAAATAAKMEQERTVMGNANGLSSNGSLDNTPLFNTGGGVTAASKLMLGGGNAKKRKGGNTVSASLGL